MVDAQGIISSIKKKVQKVSNPYVQAENVARDYAKERAYSQNKKFIMAQERQRAYQTSNPKTARAGSFFSGLFNTARTPGGFTRLAYRKSMPVKPGYAVASTPRSIPNQGRGRPKGTLDPRYAKFGGIYGYRHAMAQQRRLDRIEAMRRATVSPEQEQVLRRIEARQNAIRINPENRVIPDTDGKIDMRRFNQDVNDAVGLVD